MLIEVFAGRPPWSARSSDTVSGPVMAGKQPDELKDVPFEQLRALLGLCLSPVPDNRPNANEVLALVDEYGSQWLGQDREEFRERRMSKTNPLFQFSPASKGEQKQLDESVPVVSRVNLAPTVTAPSLHIATEGQPKFGF